MEVVVGCNVSGIIEGVMQKDTVSIIELSKLIVESSKSSTLRFEKLNENVPFNNYLDKADGI